MDVSIVCAWLNILLVLNEVVKISLFNDIMEPADFVELNKVEIK